MHDTRDRKWHRFLKSFTLFRTALIQESYIETILKYIPIHTNILEVACGSGLTSVLLSDLGYNVVCTDRNTLLLDDPARKFAGFERLSVEQLDMFRLGQSYPSGHFDLIFHQGVLEHFDDAEIVAALKQQAKVAGYVIFDVPNDIRSDKTGLYGDERFLPVERWKELCIESGFDVLDVVGRRFEGDLDKVKAILGREERNRYGTSSTFVLKSKWTTPDRLHYGCGTVYLDGYLNVDAAPDFYSMDRSELARTHLHRNRTNYANYYKESFSDVYPNRDTRRIVVDMDMSLKALAGIFTHRFSELVMVHCLEHIPRYELDDFFADLKRIMRKDCRCVFAVPDNPAMVRLYLDAKTREDRAMYHNWIFGSQRNRYSHHFNGYDEEMLTALLHEHFQRVEYQENKNEYPALWVACTGLKE
uniref:Methyltransferase domain-containing protein n=1 Tax=Candidatus Kentrum sp. TUN TaxID=2126343 RepID=A0A451A169_9GAMM|nr:MAG: Methyltransferase domain-containing protein [Candidatus Kentron sp. TUN]